MGLLWSFFNPVFMLVVYTFVFSVVFRARWLGGSDSKVEFALVLFTGLLVYNLFSEVLNRAPSLILNNANYVKKVIFPLEVLGIDPACTSTTASIGRSWSSAISLARARVSRAECPSFMW